jgi:hypothetical protein
VENARVRDGVVKSAWRRALAVRVLRSPSLSTPGEDVYDFFIEVFASHFPRS